MRLNGIFNHLAILLSFLSISQCNIVEAQLPNCLSPHHSRRFIQDNNTIVTRFSPMPIGTQAIRALGTPLGEVIFTGDLQAVAAAHIQSRLVRGSLPSETYRHWLAQTDTPDTIALFRSQQITVFPRVLLLHPQIAAIRILPGDAIVTFSLGSSPDDVDDPIKDFFERRLGFRHLTLSNESGTVTFVNYQREITRLTVPVGQSLGNSLPWDYEVIEADLIESSSKGLPEERAWQYALHSLTAVNILTRTVGGYHVRWIIPSKHFGAIGYSGHLFQRLLSDEYWLTEFQDAEDDPRGSLPPQIGLEAEEKLIEQWNAILSRFSGITLAAGDHVESVTLEMNLRNLLRAF